MAGIEFKRCAECSTEEVAVYHGPNGEIAHRTKGPSGFGNLIDGLPPEAVSGAPRVNMSGLLALLMAGALSVNGARSEAGEGEPKAPKPRFHTMADVVDLMSSLHLQSLTILPEEAAGITDLPDRVRAAGIDVTRSESNGKEVAEWPEDAPSNSAFRAILKPDATYRLFERTEAKPRSLADAVDQMKRERLSVLRFSPEEAAVIEDAPEEARTRGLILSRDESDFMKPPGVLHALLIGRGELLRVFLPFEAKPQAAKDPEPAPAPAAPAAGPNPPPLKSLGLHLCPDGGVVVTEWPEGAGLPPCLYASASAGHAVGYALTLLKAGRKAICEEAKAAGQEKPPARPVIVGVDLASGPDGTAVAFDASAFHITR